MKCEEGGRAASCRTRQQICYHVSAGFPASVSVYQQPRSSCQRSLRGRLRLLSNTVKPQPWNRLRVSVAPRSFWERWVWGKPQTAGGGVGIPVKVESNSDRNHFFQKFPFHLLILIRLL